MGILDVFKKKKKRYEFTPEDREKALRKRRIKEDIEDQIDLNTLRELKEVTNNSQKPLVEQLKEIDITARMLGYVKPEELEGVEGDQFENQLLQMLMKPTNNNVALSATPDPPVQNQVDMVDQVIRTMPQEFVQGIKSGVITEKMALDQGRKQSDDIVKQVIARLKK